MGRESLVAVVVALALLQSCSSDAPGAVDSSNPGVSAGGSAAGAAGAASVAGGSGVAGGTVGGAGTAGGTSSAAGSSAQNGTGGSGVAGSAQPMSMGGGPAGGAGAGAGTGAAGMDPMTAGTSGSAAAGSGGSQANPSMILAPAQGALLGAYYGAGSLAETMSKLGRGLPIHLVYWAWDDEWERGSTQADLSTGRIPLVNWEPAGIDFNDIVGGSLDSTIEARAKGAKALGKQFFLDFAAEMNGDEAWSGNDAPLYVAAYKHIHDIFEAAGASNVVWAWCPNVTDTRGGNAMTLEYYPGDDYVDWTCVDGYNWGSSNGGWQTFQQVFARIYPILASKGKPILIGEMASAEGGGDKGQWIDQMIPTLENEFPLIKAVVWFDVDKENDWRISSSAGSEAAFKRMAMAPYFNP